MEIKERIDEAILRESAREARERKYLYVSDIFQCQRKIMLEYNKLETKGFDARTLRVFDNGNKVHERVIKYLADAGYEPEEEITIPENVPNIHGRLDAKIIDGGKPKIVEIKSINMRNVTEAKPEHVAQLMIYMHFTKINDGYLIYESKQTQELFFFPVTYDKELWDKIDMWIEETNKLMKQNTIPNIPFGFRKDKYPCGWCKFQNHCWGEGEPKTVVKPKVKLAFPEVKMETKKPEGYFD